LKGAWLKNFSKISRWLAISLSRHHMSPIANIR
jgi:hypothetical protein